MINLSTGGPVPACLTDLPCALNLILGITTIEWLLFAGIQPYDSVIRQNWKGDNQPKGHYVSLIDLLKKWKKLGFFAKPFSNSFKISKFKIFSLMVNSSSKNVNFLFKLDMRCKSNTISLCHKKFLFKTILKLN